MALTITAWEARERTKSSAQKWIGEHEDFLTEHRNNPGMVWPLKRCARYLAGRGNGRAVNAVVAVRPEPAERHPEHWAGPFIIEVQAADGHLDGAQLQALADQLQAPSYDVEVHTVVLDLSQVASTTAAFLNLLKAVRKQLARRDKDIMLCHVRSQCADLLRGTGFEDTIHCLRPESEVPSTATGAGPPQATQPQDVNTQNDATQPFVPPQDSTTLSANKRAPSRRASTCCG
jgi:anti-anti-sigma factor